MKDITIEIINTNLHNVKYEDEDNIEEENNSIIQNKIKYKKNNIIQNLNWLNSFDSQILKNIDINYIAKIINNEGIIFDNSNQKFYEISQITNISLTIDIDYFKNSFFILNGTTFSRGDICLGHESNCVEVFELL